MCQKPARKQGLESLRPKLNLIQVAFLSVGLLKLVTLTTQPQQRETARHHRRAWPWCLRCRCRRCPEFGCYRVDLMSFWIESHRSRAPQSWHIFHDGEFIG